MSAKLQWRDIWGQRLGQAPKITCWAILGLWSALAWGQQLNPQLQGVEDSFYDPNFDYAHFYGRITDRGEDNNVIKIESETPNTKLLQLGDVVHFKIPVAQNKKKDHLCAATVRGVEDRYFVVYLNNIRQCWPQGDYLRRGTRLSFDAPIMAVRARDASRQRQILIQNKNDFFKQLSEINNFLAAFEQKRLQLAALYDKQVAKILQEKRHALELLNDRKADYITLQAELAKRLSVLEKDLEYYRLGKENPEDDRWHKDLDLGLPVSDRPPPLEEKAQL